MPPWANGSPNEFVRINREALESEYVSEHLNEWIDLIWGFKQNGVSAIEACNVFYYLTYPDSVNISSIEDPLIRQSVLSQKLNFGQMPEQLFKKPHPKRQGKSSILPQKIDPKSRMAEEFSLVSKILPAPVVHSFVNGKSAVFVCENGFYCGNNIVPVGPSSQRLNSKSELLLFTLEMDRVAMIPKLHTPNQYGTFIPQQVLDQTIKLPSLDGISLLESVAYSPDHKLLFVGGSWDGSLRIHNLSGKVIRSVPVSTDVITSVAYDNGFLVIGSRDTTAHIYNLSPLIKSPGLLTKYTPQTDAFSQRSCTTIAAHQFPIRFIAVSEDFDMVITISHGKSPRCTVHALRTGTFLREIKMDTLVDCALISSEGNIVLYSSSGATINVLTVNCDKIASLTLPHAPRRNPPPMAVSTNGKFFAMATTETAVSIYSIHNLKLISEYNTAETITSLNFVCDDNGIIAALEDTSITGFNLISNNY